MNTCQHCGTELNSKRAKNCPTCASLLNDAYKRNGYDLAMSAISEAKQIGLAGNDVQEAIRQAAGSGSARENEWINKQRQAKNEWQERNHERIEFYRQHGYYPDQKIDDEDIAAEMEALHNHIPLDPGEPEIFG